MRVPAPRFNQVLVNYLCTFDPTIDIIVEFSGSICSRHQVDNSIITPIPQLLIGPAGLIKNSIPGLISNKGLRVHNSPIAEDNGRRFILDRTEQEVVFQQDPRLHQLQLEPEYFR